jgi:hypothetical protein
MVSPAVGFILTKESQAELATSELKTEKFTVNRFLPAMNAS